MSNTIDCLKVMEGSSSIDHIKKPQYTQNEEFRKVFVRNLSYDCTDEDLAEIFMESGPVKRAAVRDVM